MLWPCYKRWSHEFCSLRNHPSRTKLWLPVSEQILNFFFWPLIHVCMYLFIYLFWVTPHEETDCLSGPWAVLSANRMSKDGYIIACLTLLNQGCLWHRDGHVAFMKYEPVLVWPLAFLGDSCLCVSVKHISDLRVKYEAVFTVSPA